jgi:hypothetical protein
MRADLKRTNLLFKTKGINKQPTNRSSGWGGDEWHNTVEGGWTYSGEGKVADLVGKHLQT